MTFPDFVSKNVQYVLDAGDRILVLTCSIPEDRFDLYEKTMDAICTSLVVKKATPVAP